MAKEKLYFKLGSKASTFVDPKSGLKIINGHIGVVDARRANGSKVLKDAIEGGHIKEATKAEYDEDQAAPSKAAKARRDAKAVPTAEGGIPLDESKEEGSEDAPEAPKAKTKKKKGKKG